jgi:hypothetical protein
MHKFSLVQYKIMDMPASFILIIILFKKRLNVAMLRNFEFMLGQTLNHSV